MALKYLLDTHIVLWWLLDDIQLSKQSKSIISDPRNQIFVSSVSAWELSVKDKLGRLPEAGELIETFPQYIRKARFAVLPISIEHALLAGSLSSKHKDPFDRMLIAQAKIEKLTIISTDRIFKAFEIETIC